MHHFLQGWSYESAQTDDISSHFLRCLQNLRGRNHHPEINDFVIVTAQHNPDDILADVVDVTLHGGHNNAALATGLARCFFLRLHVGQEMSDGLFHHPRALDHLRQEHLAGPKQIADHIHPSHQRALDHRQRTVVFQARFFCVLLNEIDDAFHQGMAEPFLDGPFAPFILYDLGFALLLNCFRELNQPFGSVRPPVQ